MAYIRTLYSPELLIAVQNALGKTQETLGQLLGVSRRTMTRWQGGSNSPPIESWALLARHVHGADAALAERIASEMGETLVSLGIVPPPPAAKPAPAAAALPPRPHPPIGDLVDSIVCAAAEAVSTTPQSIRPALLAAFDRTASIQLTVDAVRAALRSASRATKPSEA
jgi:DNA-binding XRE family transcriptional regulator